MGTLVTHVLFYNLSFLLLFIVHTGTAEHPDNPPFPASFLSVFPLSAEKEKTFMPILNEQKEGKHIM